jgi:hypothetical protein
MHSKGESPERVFKFWEKLQRNPSYRSVEQLWGFLANANIPLNEDGDILAYKSITADLKDHHSKTVDNTPGVVNEMPRNQISDDPNEACHFGYHVGALAYAVTFGSADRRVVIVKVDPENVVCVPYDCSMQKMRVCKYEVVGFMAVPLPSTSFDEDRYGDDPEDDEECTDCDSSKCEGDCQGGENVGLCPTCDSDDHGQCYPDEPIPKRDLSTMEFDDLMDVTLEELRRYATHDLKIVGASKIPGGKYALVTEIIDVRG